MKLAADFRRIARETLSGKWTLAVLVGFVAIILGGVAGMSPEFKVNIDASGTNASFAFAGQTIFSTGGEAPAWIGRFLIGGFTYIMIAALVMGVIYFILGSVIKVGYAKFNLNLVDRAEGSFENLFEYFTYWKTTATAKLLMGIFILFWTLCFIVPGIIASYSYAMTEYVLAEHPEISASEAMRRSKQMMEGNRLRLFCLHFSFIGWDILCSFTLGIGNFWLTPYKEAATAVFYREVSGTEHREYENEWSAEANWREI